MFKMNSNNKHLVLMRGIPGCGKSTFTRNVLAGKAVIVSPDEIRIERNGLVTVDGIPHISQDNPKQIWAEVDALLQSALQLEQIVVLDATCTVEKTVNKYRKMAEENDARFVVIDFSGRALDVCIAQNASREDVFRRVPESVLHRMYAQITNEIQSGVDKYFVTPEEIEVD